MHSQVKNYIRSRVQIPDGDLEKSLQFTEVKYFKKGEYILKIGEY
jgi:hypothetical protein